jgi:hypothetical protein
MGTVACLDVALREPDDPAADERDLPCARLDRVAYQHGL